MIKKIQQLPQALRVLVFIGMIILAVLVAFGVTLGLVWYLINGTPRSTAVVMDENYTVREFAQLSDADAYPSGLALDAQGTLYTASYVTGTVWQITPEGIVTELPNTRETFGAVAALSVGADNALYVLDRHEPLKSVGATIWRVDNTTAPQAIAQIPAEDVLIPYDLALDASGQMYVSVVVDGGADQIWRFAPDGTNVIWWTAPANATITGLAVSTERDSLFAVDTRQNAIYEIPLGVSDAARVIYQYDENRAAPALDGITVAPNNILYVTALGFNRVAQIDLNTGELHYLAGAFRQATHTAYDPQRQRLYVNNLDARSLLPEQFLFLQLDVFPKLPFGIDVIEVK